MLLYIDRKAGHMPGEIKALGEFVAALGKTSVTPRALERVASDAEAMQAIKECIDEQVKRLRKIEAGQHADRMKVEHLAIKNLLKLDGVEYCNVDSTFEHLVNVLEGRGITRAVQLTTLGQAQILEFGLSEYDCTFIEEVLRVISRLNK